jgi:hypothetical protein
MRAQSPGHISDSVFTASVESDFFCAREEFSGADRINSSALHELTGSTKPNRIRVWRVRAAVAQLPPRSTAGQQILDLLIGVRIPGGQPIQSSATSQAQSAQLCHGTSSASSPADLRWFGPTESPASSQCARVFCSDRHRFLGLRRSVVFLVPFRLRP